MLFEETPLAGNYLINLELSEDNRGFFARYFCKNQFKLHGLCCDWVQINNSCCHDTGTLRGLHFQILPYSETKLVRCIWEYMGCCSRFKKRLQNIRKMVWLYFNE